jgi:hypothetical protein
VIASEAREAIAVLLESFVSDDLLKFEESGDKPTAPRMLMNVVPAGLVKHFGHRHTEGIRVVLEDCMVVIRHRYLNLFHVWLCGCVVVCPAI